jgi:hypothetical protein
MLARVGDEGRAAVVLVLETALDGPREQAQLSVERRLPLRRRHRLQVSEGASSRRVTCGNPPAASRISSNASRT